MSSKPRAKAKSAPEPKDFGELPEWDLRDLYPDPDSAEMQRDLAWCDSETKAFAAVSKFVVNDFGRSYFAMCGKEIRKILIFQIPTKVSYVNVHFEKFKK